MFSSHYLLMANSESVRRSALTGRVERAVLDERERVFDGRPEQHLVRLLAIVTAQHAWLLAPLGARKVHKPHGVPVLVGLGSQHAGDCERQIGVRAVERARGALARDVFIYTAVAIEHGWVYAERTFLLFLV